MTDPRPAHQRAAVIAIGDEMTLGERLDTNTRWLAAQLVGAGITVDLHLTAPDDLGLITDAFTHAARGRQLVIATGGLGPTEDDLTRRALAAAAGEALVTDEHALALITAWFEQRGKSLIAKNAVQAMRPASGRCLANPLGTAPGLAVRLGDADVFCLPGPPREMTPMFEADVRPALRPAEGRAVLARAFLTAGIGESTVAHKLGDLMNRDRNPNISTTATLGMVTCRIRSEGALTDDTKRAMDALERELHDRIGEHIIATGETTIGEHIVRSLRTHGTMLVTAESCTGGLVGQTVTAVPGSSDVYLGGCIAYHNETKIAQLGVARETLDTHGAVSAETALAMARGVIDRFARESDPDVIGLAVTGVAGPSGGSEEKPVGTVFIALARKAGGKWVCEDVRRFRFPGPRDDVRERTCVAALTMTSLTLRERASPTLLWQIP